MNKNKIEVTLVIVFSLMIVVIRNISYKSFVDYENTILSQQKAHLLTIAKSTAKSLELHIDEKIKEISNVADNLVILSEQVKLSDERIENQFRLFYYSQNEEISELRYIDENKNSNIVYPMNKSSLNDKDFNNNFERVRAMKLAYVGKPWKNIYGKFSMYIYQPLIIYGEFKGIILAKINLDNIYDKLVKPIKAGEHGYATVKDNTGLILMHPVQEQIGYDVLKTRRQKYPDLDFDDLEKLIKRQLTGEEGTEIYYSYWWPQTELKRVKKLNGFAPSFIGDDFWIVAIDMSYDEISAPIKKYFYSSMLVSFVIILVFAWTISLLIKIIKNKEAYIMESSYLQELNKNTDELRKKEAELHHKRKMETIGTLTGGIAHEFNNILTPIMGYSEMILRDLNPESEMYEDVKVIYDSSKKSQEIIDQILTYSDDKIDVKYEVLFLNEILVDMKKPIVSQLTDDIEFKLLMENSKNFIFGNETQIHQVIINLVKNAVNAMTNSDEKELVVKLSKVLGEDKCSYSKISVSDTGCGMTEETKERIFNPFYTEKLAKNSTGLGLSVVMGIIEKHGGSIEVSTELGKGSCFDLFIPQIDQEKNKESKVEESSEEIELTGNEKVLILDNEEFIVKMIKKGLDALGYETKSYSNGYDIIEEFDELSDLSFDILITDLTMPEISGIELAKLLRMKNEKMKVILMTAHPEEPLENYIKSGLINEYLLKPVSPNDISRMIRKIIDK